MNNFEKSIPPEFSGIHISVDEMSPKVNEDGTVELHTFKMHEKVKVGEVIRVGSNENRDLDGFGEIVKLDDNLIVLKMLD